MSLALINYLETVRLNSELESQRELIMFAIRHPFRIGMLSLIPEKIKSLKRSLSNHLRARDIAHLCIANPVVHATRDAGQYWVATDALQANLWRVCFDEIGVLRPIGAVSLRAAKLAFFGDRSRLALVHAHYREEALYIFERLSKFPDFDIVLTTGDREIAQEFFRLFSPDRAVCLLIDNQGRDVLPFLLALQLLDLARYTHFIKIHTKRSQHLRDNGRWFRRNIEILAGNRLMTEVVFSKIDASKSSIFGVECLPLQDHKINNSPWLSYLCDAPVESVEGRFVPGTMFVGSAAYLSSLARRNLHLNYFEPELGQLDGCFIHALERYFGYLTQVEGGLCGTIAELAGLGDCR